MIKTDKASTPIPTVMNMDARQFRWMFVMAFTMFLVVAFAARLLGWKWRPWPPGPEGYKSVFQEAKRAVDSFIPFAFLT